MRLNGRTVLAWVVVLNLVASAIHYSHNAMYFDAYPNEPVWLSPGRIDLLWFVISPLALAGYWLWSRGHDIGGRLLLGGYALLGLGVLGHYWLAPLAAHTAAMNLTIVLEALMALVLLASILILRPCARAPAVAPP